MKELTEAEYEKVGNELCEFVPLSYGYAKSIGRAAVAAVAPLVLAEPDSEEVRAALGIGGNGARYAIRNLLAARLGRLTAKSDPAVEAVKAWITSEKRPGSDTEFAALIVEAVDKARGEAQLDALPRARVK